MLEWCNLRTLHYNYFVNLFVAQVYPIHMMTFFIFLTVFGLSVVFPCKGKVCTWEKHYMDMGIQALSCLEGHNIGSPNWLRTVCYINLYVCVTLDALSWTNDSVFNSCFGQITLAFSAQLPDLLGRGGSVPPWLVHLCTWKPII